MTTTKSQTSQILKHLKAGHSISPISSLKKFGCFRLAARISELRNDGHDIKTKIVRTPNGHRVASYSL